MKYQHVYTTKEQVLRLKAAGVPAESADCTLEAFDGEKPGKDNMVVFVTEYEEGWDMYEDDNSFPCWSLGRLIELITFVLVKHHEQQKLEPLYMKVDYTPDIVEDMVRWFERNKQLIDYSILRPDRKPAPKPEPKRVENCAIRYFGSTCPLNNRMEVDQYNCVECEHYFATASKSIICKIAQGL